MGVSRGSTNLGTLGLCPVMIEAWLTPRNMLPCRIWSSYQHHERAYGDLPKNGPLPSRLSRSLKVIKTDTDRSATCDFLLVIHSNHGPLGENLKFTPPLYLMPPPTAFPLEFCNGGEAQKTGRTPLPACRKI